MHWSGPFFFLGVLLLASAVFDMMGNGGRYADWAPYGIGLGMICILIGLALS